jgi:multidrug efflux pump subunit AcrA (membrane-fusion protein)
VTACEIDHPAILIGPAQAPPLRAAGMQVAVLSADSTIHLRNVTLGRTLGLTVEVTSGLAINDKIVAHPSLDPLAG